MFGYVRAKRSELLVRQDMLYRSVYCGLCREMGKVTGHFSRAVLSYDMVFLYLVRAGLCAVTPKIETGRCAVHPFRSMTVVCHDNELEYAARVGILLVYCKLCDDIADERGIKKLRAKLLKLLFGRAKKRAGLDELYGTMRRHLFELSELEKKQAASVDAVADCFGRLLGEVFSYGLSGDEKTVASSVGFHTGRWIYALDAADDAAEDAKKGKYNPFILLYGDKTAEQYGLIFNALCLDSENVTDALGLSRENELLKIAENISALGMPEFAGKILFGKSKRKDGAKG